MKFSDIPKSAIALVVLAILLRTFFFEPFAIRSSAMLPNLYENDVVLLNKFSYGLSKIFSPGYLFRTSNIAPGELVIFRDPKGGKEVFVERVVAVAGDEVMFHGGQLFINSKKMSLDEEMLLEEKAFSWAKYLPRNLSEYKVFKEKVGEHTYSVVTYKNGGRNNFAKEIVPEGKVFVLGDNRENALDSRNFGFLPEDLILGKLVGIWFSCDQSFSKEQFICDPRSIRWPRIFSKLD